MRYSFVKNGIKRILELRDRKTIDIREFPTHIEAKKYFERQRDIEKRRGSQVEYQGEQRQFKNKRSKFKPFIRTEKVLGQKVVVE